MKLTREEFDRIAADLYYLGSANDQHVDTGLGVTVEVWQDTRYFYVTAEVDLSLEELLDEFPDMSPEYYGYAEKDANNAWVKTDSESIVAQIVRRMFSSSDHGFYYDEDREEYIVY